MSTRSHTSSLPQGDEPVRLNSERDAPRLRLWMAMFLVAVYWAFSFANHSLEMAMFTRFISRFLVLALFVLLFLAWWFTRRAIPLRDRFLGLALLVTTAVLAGFFADPSIGIVGTLITGLPIALTAWAVWLLVSRSLTYPARRLGVAIATVAVFSCFTLLRWEGLDGAQRSQIAWRWTPTAEELFLAGRAKTGAVAQAAHVSAAGDAAPWKVVPGDWPEFRASGRAGVVTGTNISTDWEARPPREIWRKRIGPAWSSMILVDGNLVTQEQRADKEAVVCYDAATGEEKWVHTDVARFDETLSGAGPRGTPTFAENRLFSFGATGRLNCLDAPTGQVLWSHDLVAEAGGQAPQWGFAQSPLVVDGLVIVYSGGDEGRGVIAYRVEDGTEIWSRPGGVQTYSSPQLVRIDGTHQVLLHDNRKIAAYDVEHGATLWERPAASEVAIPTIQPHVVGNNLVLLAHDPGLALIEVKQSAGEWNITDRWQSNRLKPSFNDVVIHDGAIYGLDDGILCCLDLESGERRWKRGRYGHGQVLLLADQGLLLVMGEKGLVTLVAADPERHEELCQFQSIEGKTWNHPVLSRGRLFVRNDEQIACYELPTSADSTAQQANAAR